MNIPTSARPTLISLAATISLLDASGCAAAKATPRRPANGSMSLPTLPLGSCGEPDRDGQMSDTPIVQHADRDLDGDGIAEVVISDRSLCDTLGNCYWNLFIEADGCQRFAGTIAGASLQVDRTISQGAPKRSLGSVQVGGPRRWPVLRANWKLPSGRFLLQQYMYQEVVGGEQPQSELNGYRVMDSVLCVNANDSKLMCANPVPSEHM